jgi:hypothetical protein
MWMSHRPLLATNQRSRRLHAPGWQPISWQRRGSVQAPRRSTVAHGRIVEKLSGLMRR